MTYQQLKLKLSTMKWGGIPEWLDHKVDEISNMIGEGK